MPLPCRNRAAASNLCLLWGRYPAQGLAQWCAPRRKTGSARGSVFVVPAQPERMPGRIQQNPDVVLRLELGDLRAMPGLVRPGR